MAGYIIRDFFGAFRIGSLRQNKALYTSIYLTVYIVFMSFFVNRGWSDRQTAWQNAISEIALFLPMIFSLCSVQLHPVQFTKIMYLCPLSPDERRMYIYGSYCFRTGMHMLVSVLGLCVIAANSNCDMVSAIQILLNDALIAAMVNHRQFKGRAVVVEAVISVTAFLSNAVQFCTLLDIAPHYWIRLVSFFTFVFVQLPLEIWYAKYTRKVLQAAIYYEGSLEN